MQRHRSAMSAGSLIALLTVAVPGAAAQVPASAAAPDRPAETRWVVDMVHSQVDFGVRHLVGRVRGSFERWYAVLTTERGQWPLGNVSVTIQTASLNTGNAYRDADLRSDRFFAASRYPTMTFEGTGMAVADSTVKVMGVLTIKGHSKPVTLSGAYRGIAKDAGGHQRIAFEVAGEIDRRDFGIDWNEKVAGAEMIGNAVEITIGIEAVRADEWPALVSHE